MMNSPEDNEERVSVKRFLPKILEKYAKLPKNYLNSADANSQPSASTKPDARKSFTDDTKNAEEGELNKIQREQVAEEFELNEHYQNLPWVEEELEEPSNEVLEEAVEAEVSEEEIRFPADSVDFCRRWKVEIKKNSPPYIAALMDMHPEFSKNQIRHELLRLMAYFETEKNHQDYRQLFSNERKVDFNEAPCRPFSDEEAAALAEGRVRSGDLSLPEGYGKGN